MIHNYNEIKRNQEGTALINSNTFLGCLHSNDGVQFFHLNLPSSTHLFLPPM